MLSHVLLVFWLLGELERTVAVGGLCPKWAVPRVKEEEGVGLGVLCVPFTKSKQPSSNC